MVLFNKRRSFQGLIMEGYGYGRNIFVFLFVCFTIIQQTYGKIIIPHCEVTKTLPILLKHQACVCI